ncbi:glycosyltransferase [Streptomyces sp. NPDC006798]|uniref:glycosyltransferase n=1 Tax=Streptomyces sp. NPDC006798 TaxID=3155462 RepID=UPI0033C8C4B9
MDISRLSNPYDFRNPVRDAAHFAGRGAETATVRYQLAQAGVGRPSVCVVLHGQRAAGKTSLLNAIDRMAREDGRTTVRIELLDGDGEPVAFFRKLYEETAVAVADALTAPDGTAPFDLPAVRRVMHGAVPEPGDPWQFPEAVALAGPTGPVPEAALRADLARIVGLLGHPLVLLVDEAQVMAADARVLSALRFLTSRVDGLVLVLAGTSGLIDQIRDVHAQILRQFKEIEVRRFTTHEEVYDCVVRPLRAIGLPTALAPAPMAAELMHLTGGNPYEIQLYCHEIFARWQRGLTDSLQLTAEVVEAIRSQLETGRDLMERPLIRAVRAMDTQQLVAFNILTSALGDGTADDVWFAHVLGGPPQITRSVYDSCRARLVADGILADTEVIDFAVETELLDEIYARAWTAGRLPASPHPQHAQITSRGGLRALLVNRILKLLHSFSDPGPLRILPTCCPAMSADDVERNFAALENLPDQGPDATPTVDMAHSAILRAGEPRALDLTSVRCGFGELTVERWLYAADHEDVELTERPEYAEALARIEGAGGQLTADRVRIPLRSRPADQWLARATGRLRRDLADNHVSTAYDRYAAADRDGALRHFRLAFELIPDWEQANSVLYLSLVAGDVPEALTWGGRAHDLASHPIDRALSTYNWAMARLLDGDPGRAGDLLARAAAELEALSVTGQMMEYLLRPDPAAPRRLREEREVDLYEAVCSAQEVLGLPPGGGSSAPLAGPPAVPAADGTTPEPVPATPVVLAVATEWSSSHGGLSTFNRELCRALRASGAEVYCVVLDVTPAEREQADQAGVVLLPARRVPGGSDDLRLAARPELPEGTVPDLIVGHGRITGPAAQRLTLDFFPNARRLHIVHMAPDEIEWHKRGRDVDAGRRAAERTGIERQLGSGAHRVVAVGPRLHDQYQAEFTTVPRPPLRLDPGFDGGTRADGPRTPPGGSTWRVLLLGRTDDAELKGVRLAAAACGRVDRWVRDDQSGRVRLVVRGAPPGTSEDQQAEISAWSGSTMMNVTVREYTAEEEAIAHDLDAASLVLMPSRTEGFGLVGVEAIARGVPVLVSGESGLGELLRETVEPQTAGRFVVPVTGDHDADTETWARAVERVLRDRENAFRRVAELREALTRSKPWAAAAEAILAEAADGH